MILGVKNLLLETINDFDGNYTEELIAREVDNEMEERKQGDNEESDGEIVLDFDFKFLEKEFKILKDLYVQKF